MRSCQNPFLIDFGRVFRVGDAICDYTKCQASIQNLLATVSSLIGRRVTEDECRECERLLRGQYLARLPSLHSVDSDSYVYRTPWPLVEQGGLICIRITVVFHRGSIKVAGATSKMTEFALCDLIGKQIGAARDLPWHLANYQAVAYAIRNIWCGRFPHGLLSQQLFAAWHDAGGNSELPQRLPLCDTPDGQELEVAFAHGEQPNSWDGGKPIAVAKLILDGEAVQLEKLQPKLLVDLDPGAFNEEAFLAFMDLAADAQGIITLADLRSHLCRVFDLYATHQPQDIVDLDNGWRVFNTCIAARAGGDVFAVLADPIDVRFTSIVWVAEESLSGYGCRVPARPDLQVVTFSSPSGSVGSICSPHVLAHASRWAAAGRVIGIDDWGRDVFAKGSDASELYAKASAELNRTLAYVSTHPGEVAYGYYDSRADRKGLNAYPVCAYLPAFFSEMAKASLQPDAAFVARLVGGHWEIPTVLRPEWVKASCRALGCTTMPGWVLAA